MMVLLVHPLVSATDKSTQATTEQALRSMVVEYPDSVLGILDRIEKSAKLSLSPVRISLMRALAYNEKRMFAYVNKYVREALESDSIDALPKIKTNALTLLSMSQLFFGNLQGSIESCSEAIEIARQSGNLPAELNILTKMALNYFALDDRKKGYEVIETIINNGASSDDVRVLANVSAAYGVKIVQLYGDNRFAEALRESQKRLDLISRIDNIGGAPDGYTDQQRAYTYARIACTAEKNGNPTEAAAAYASFLDTDYGRSEVGKPYIADYLLDAGKYSTVLEYTSPLFAKFERTDTINDDYYSLLTVSAKALSGLGNYKLGFHLMERANVIQDSIYMRQKNTQAQELATVFALNENQLELQKEKAESQKRLILLWSAAGIILLVVVILIILWWQFRIVKRHNRLAARRIDELLEQHEHQREVLAVTDENKDNKNAFVKMEQTIVSGLLFKNPNFNRDDICKATGLSRNMVIQLIQEFADLTPSDYITRLRLEYSVKLLKEHPEWSIDGIAEGCGYVRRATYYSHFNKFYGLTPAQYRKELKNENAQE